MDFNARAEIQAATLCRVCSMISNCTDRYVFCCMNVARETTWLPIQMSCTYSRVRSHAQSLLSIAKLNSANSRTLDDI